MARQIRYMEGNPPIKDLIFCHLQGFYLTAMATVLAVLGLFIQPIIILFIAEEQAHNAAGIYSPVEHNRLKYPKASGWWDFTNVPAKYKTGNFLQRFLWLYGNDMDGYLGDKRGEWSDIRGGKEKSFLSMWLWSALRNKLNNLRFSGKLYSVVPDDCEEVWIYGYDLEVDNKPIDEGWYFIKAISGGRTYYAYRAVRTHNDWDDDPTNDWSHNASVAFKLQPKHFVDGQAEAKGATFRYTVI